MYLQRDSWVWGEMGVWNKQRNSITYMQLTTGQARLAVWLITLCHRRHAWETWVSFAALYLLLLSFPLGPLISPRVSPHPLLPPVNTAQTWEENTYDWLLFLLASLFSFHVKFLQMIGLWWAPPHVFFHGLTSSWTFWLQPQPLLSRSVRDPWATSPLSSLAPRASLSVFGSSHYWCLACCLTSLAADFSMCSLFSPWPSPSA